MTVESVYEEACCDECDQSKPDVLELNVCGEYRLICLDCLNHDLLKYGLQIRPRLNNLGERLNTRPLDVMVR
jgi:hypothetical protein